MWYNIVVVDKHALSIPNSLNAYILLACLGGWEHLIIHIFMRVYVFSFRQKEKRVNTLANTIGGAYQI